MSQNLPDIPGKDLTAVIVKYRAGGKSAPDRHASRRASTHLVSENASAIEVAQLLAVFVADALAQFPTNEKQ